MRATQRHDRGDVVLAQGTVHYCVDRGYLPHALEVDWDPSLLMNWSGALVCSGLVDGREEHHLVTLRVSLRPHDVGRSGYDKAVLDLFLRWEILQEA